MDQHTFGSSKQAEILVDIIENSDTPETLRRVASRRVHKFYTALNYICYVPDTSTKIRLLQLLYKDTRISPTHDSFERHLSGCITAYYREALRKFNKQLSKEQSIRRKMDSHKNNCKNK